MDPFSSYRAGFEVRAYRLCQRVLMFHHFAGEAGVGGDCLVRSTDFAYSYEEDLSLARNPVYTFLRGVTQTGYKRNGGGTGNAACHRLSSSTASPSCKTPSKTWPPQAWKISPSGWTERSTSGSICTAKASPAS